MTISDKLLDELIGDAKTDNDVFGKGGLIKMLSKRLVERMLEGEMEHHLGYSKGCSLRTMFILSKYRNPILTNFIPKLLPAAFCFDQWTEAQHNLDPHAFPLHSTST